MNSTTGIDLSNIKRQEAFVMNLIDACAFAANNIRNIVDREGINDGEKQDILSPSLTKRIRLKT